MTEYIRNKERYVVRRVVRAGFLISVLLMPIVLRRNYYEVQTVKLISSEPATFPRGPLLDLPTNFQVSCGDDFWHGNYKVLSANKYSSPPLSIVVALCEESLDWLDGLIRGLNIRRIIVYSKCGVTVGNFSSHNTTLVYLPNVGRVDHTYAYHMANLPEDTNPDEVQLFLKDTYPALHQIQLRQRSIQEVIEEAAGPTGFGCCSAPNWRNSLETTKFTSRSWFHTLLNYDAQWSAWHLSSEVTTYRLNHYSAARGYDIRDDVEFASNLTFKGWLSALEMHPLGSVMPICYAGSFAAKAANILASRQVWSRMLKLLARGDNIEEGHYAERTHAAILMPRLPPNLHDRIICLSRGVRKCSYTAGYCGVLYGCSDRCGKSA